MVTLKKILVATDFGDASAAALRYGRELATAFAATLRVLHVTEDLSVTGLAVKGYVGLPPEVLQDLVQAGHGDVASDVGGSRRHPRLVGGALSTADRAAAARRGHAKRQPIGGDRARVPAVGRPFTRRRPPSPAVGRPLRGAARRPRAVGRPFMGRRPKEDRSNF